MVSIQDTAYPHLRRNPSPKELTTLYTPTLDELELSHRVTRRPVTRLSFLVLLKTFQRLGYGIALSSVPASIIRHVVTSAQLRVTQYDLCEYDLSKARKRHLLIIREYLQIAPFNQTAHTAMVEAIEKAVLSRHDLVDLINIAIEELVRQRYELPGFSTLERSSRAIRIKQTDALYQTVHDRLSDEERQRLDKLFTTTETVTSWQYLKQEPGKALLSRLKDWAERLNWLSTLQLSHNVLIGVPLVKLQHFAAEAQTLDRYRMLSLPPAKRYTFAVSLLVLQYAQTLDDITEMFIKRMRHMHYKAKEALEQYRIETQRRTDELILRFQEVVTAYQIEGNTTQRFNAIAQAIGDDPQTLLEQCEAHLSHKDNNYLPFLLPFYRSHRSTLFHLIELLRLKPSSHDHTLSESIAFIQKHRTKRRSWISITEIKQVEDSDEQVSVPIIDIRWIPMKWWPLITGQEERLPHPHQIHRTYFEICVFSHLLLEVQSGDMYVDGSNEYSDYYSELISWEDYQATVEDYAQEVDLPVNPSEFVAQLKQWLSTRATQTDQSFPSNGKLSFNKDRFVVHRYRRNKPADLAQLEALLKERLQPTHVLDVLTDTELWLHWTRFFKPISGHESRLEQPIVRYLLTTFCYGCNVGPSQTARSFDSIDRRQFSWVHRRHVSQDGLQSAITHIINAYNHFDLPKFWGTGKHASVDGTKWEMYEQNLLAEYHIRYGGYGGIGYYHISDTYIALFSHFIPCGVWEAVYILDGLLNNESEIQPDTIHGDTQAQSATVFGLAHLLGITLMPRMRNWQDLTFLRPTKKAKYKHIDALFSDTANWALIEEHLPNMLRVAMSIKSGKFKASTILRKLGTNSRKNDLFRAFHELGMVLRTGFLLEFINDEDLRKTIQGATNKSESFNRFAKWLAFGGEGVIATNDRDEQRKFIKYNHLVANCLIFYNVFQMSRVLNQLAQEGYSFSKEAIAALSPYLTEHIIRLGQYSLDLERQPPELTFDVPIMVAEPQSDEKDDEVDQTHIQQAIST